MCMCERIKRQERRQRRWSTSCLYKRGKQKSHRAEGSALTLTKTNPLQFCMTNRQKMHSIWRFNGHSVSSGKIHVHCINAPSSHKTPNGHLILHFWMKTEVGSQVKGVETILDHMQMGRNDSRVSILRAEAQTQHTHLLPQDSFTSMWFTSRWATPAFSSLWVEATKNISNDINKPTDQCANP